MNECLIVIPVRMGSTRFPGKPLIEINGKSMIYHVWKKALQAKSGEVLVACCDKIVQLHLENNKIPYVMTKKNLRSGTDRVYEALIKSKKIYKYKYVINLQGDLPNISPKDIQKLASIIGANKIKMATLVTKMKNSKKIKDKNIVKVAVTKKENNTRAIYFSRLAIPSGSYKYYEHIGIYGYKVEVLKKFVSFKQGLLEKAESLEQLRALEYGIEIEVGIVNKAPISIDTPEDLKNFLILMGKKK